MPFTLTRANTAAVAAILTAAIVIPVSYSVGSLAEKVASREQIIAMMSERERRMSGELTAIFGYGGDMPPQSATAQAVTTPAAPSTWTPIQSQATDPSYSQDPGLQAVPTSSSPQPIARADAAEPDLNADGVPLDLVPILEDSAKAGLLMEALAKATSVQTGEVKEDEQPIYAFVDPNCQFCHQMIREVLGEVPVNWIPVAMVGDTNLGKRKIASILEAEDKEAAIRKLTLPSVPELESTEEVEAKVYENASALVGIYGGPRHANVPTIFIPKDDGTLKLIRGFDQGDGPKVIRAYKEG